VQRPLIRAAAAQHQEQRLNQQDQIQNQQMAEKLAGLSEWQEQLPQNFFSNALSSNIMPSYTVASSNMPSTSYSASALLKK
jgi:hypothetical protein